MHTGHCFLQSNLTLLPVLWKYVWAPMSSCKQSNHKTFWQRNTGEYRAGSTLCHLAAHEARWCPQCGGPCSKGQFLTLNSCLYKESTETTWGGVLSQCLWQDASSGRQILVNSISIQGATAGIFPSDGGLSQEDESSGTWPEPSQQCCWGQPSSLSSSWATPLHF